MFFPKSSIVALATSLSLSNAVYQGFNFASTKPDKSIMQLEDWKAAFKAQSSLEGTNGGFTSARLYTMLKDADAPTPEPILALQAAKDDGKTSLLLGIWCSAGQAGVDKEIAALTAAIKQFPDLANQIAGISVGSEDLYRVSNIANATNATKPATPLGPGVFPSVMLSYVNQVKGNLTDKWANIPVGHVDTWTAFTNDDDSFNPGDLTNFIQALSFLGVDAYPYFQGTMDNPITESTRLFNEAYQKVLRVAAGREVWITETGWPSQGDTIRKAEASVQNAQTYWQSIGCANFGKINTWWYTFSDDHEKPSFGVVKSLSGGAPTWDLSCNGHTNQVDAAHATVSKNDTSSNPGTSGYAATPGNGTTTGRNGSNSTNGGSNGGSSQNTGSSTGNSGNSQSGAGMVTFSSLLAITGAFIAFLSVV